MINVVSLFDGMGCGRIALDRIRQPVGMYARSEIDKHASIVARANYPSSYDLGDVTRWREWPINWAEVDLVMGGSPCQGFSAAGKKGGTKAVLNGQEIIVDTREKYLFAKQAGAEFLSQSYLFWEFVLIVDHVRKHNPKVKILLENVVMSRSNLDMITRALDVGQPVFINSELVSAQSRPRYYWCNWNVNTPKDRSVEVAHILETNIAPEMCISAVVSGIGSRTIKQFQDGKKTGCLTSTYHKGAEGAGRPILIEKHLIGESLRDLKEYVISDAAKRRIERKNYSKPKIDPKKTGALNCKNNSGQLSIDSGTTLISYKGRYRRLTPIECERLQTVPDNYTNHVSNTQRYKMLGNGWTVDVITHILKEGGFGE